MEKDVFYSPSAICEDTIREASPPGWYYLLKIVVRSVLTIGLCFIACMPVKASENASVSSGDVVMTMSAPVEEREGFFTVVADDGTVIYVPETVKNYVVVQVTSGNYYTIKSDKTLYICNNSHSSYAIAAGEDGEKCRLDVYDLNGSVVNYRYIAASTNLVCEHGRAVADSSMEYFKNISRILSGNYQYCESDDSGGDSGDTGGDPGDTGGDSGGTSDDSGDTGDDSGDNDDSGNFGSGFQYPIYETYDEFMSSPLYVTRYENEVLKKLEFMQYAQAIMIALLFLLIFKRK